MRKALMIDRSILYLSFSKHIHLFLNKWNYIIWMWNYYSSIFFGPNDIDWVTKAQCKTHDVMHGDTFLSQGFLHQSM